MRTTPTDLMPPVVTAAPPTERPLVCDARTVRAILDGLQTQSRRVVSPVPAAWIDRFGYTCFTPPGHISGRGRWTAPNGEAEPAEKFIACPYGEVGDRLWVQEAWTVNLTGDPVHGGPGTVPIYREETPRASARWRRAERMPRWASRLVLEITRLEVARLQAIRHEEILAEGIDRCNSSSALMAQERFQAQWDATHDASESWGANPWVWVIGFQRVAE